MLIIATTSNRETIVDSNHPQDLLLLLKLSRINFLMPLKTPRWCDAMAKEIAAEDLPPGKHAIGFVVARGWALYQMDVHNAFLHGDLDKEVYMQLPPRFSVSTPDKGHPGQGILLRHGSALHLNAYCYSDWASCPLTRRSLIGYFILLGDSPISWKTKEQPAISRPSAEAENRSMATASCELTWLKSLLRSLGVSHSQPMWLFCDSQAALYIAANPVFHERTKHIEVDCHYVRDQIQAGTIVTAHVRSQNQLADIFTKALGRQQFTYFAIWAFVILMLQLEGEY
ncbi:UNVERIFIED_CONTAM: Retrovirus-related Pol polyprotein from transposon RE1 [Sesamum radiatum]|uniref:Retrovirus-related Pol polyprotein from transposon RE1 n=1 Tax=Sesamum radiatum TaxID=300843 RepID=A0AAW2TV29_SESRA